MYYHIQSQQDRNLIRLIHITALYCWILQISLIFYSRVFLGTGPIHDSHYLFGKIKEWNSENIYVENKADGSKTLSRYLRKIVVKSSKFYLFDPVCQGQLNLNGQVSFSIQKLIDQFKEKNSWSVLAMPWTMFISNCCDIDMKKF